MIRLLARLWRNTRGATAIEYGLLIALVAIVIVVGVQNLGSAVRNSYTNTANGFSK